MKIGDANSKFQLYFCLKSTEPFTTIIKLHIWFRFNMINNIMHIISIARFFIILNKNKSHSSDSRERRMTLAVNIC